MKKLILTILFILGCSTAHAATTWYACSGGGNWNGASVWTSVIGDIVGCIGATGNPVAGDTAIMNSSSGNIALDSATADLAATVTMTGYTGTLTLTTNDNLIVSGGTVTLCASSGCTITGTGTLQTNGTETLAAAGTTWSGSVLFNSTSTVTLNGNWITSGSTTYSGTTTLNHTTAETYSSNGLTMNILSGNGNATFILTGGTWAQTVAATWFRNNLTLAGNVTITNNAFGVSYETNTLTYSSGTITTTGSWVETSNCTLNTSGMSFYDIGFYGGTITLTSNLTATDGIFNYPYKPGAGNDWVGGTITGNFTVNTPYLTIKGPSPINFANDMTMNVTNGIWMNSDSTGNLLVSSGSSAHTFHLNYTGPLANENVSNVTFSYTVNAGTPIFNLNGGAPTRVSGIYNKLNCLKNIGSLYFNCSPNYYTGV